MRKSFWRSVFTVLVVVILFITAATILLTGTATLIVAAEYCQWCSWIAFDFRWWKDFLEGLRIPWSDVFQLSLALPVIFSLIIGAWVRSGYLRQTDDRQMDETHYPNKFENERVKLLNNVQATVKNYYAPMPYHTAFVELDKEASPNSIKSCRIELNVDQPVLQIFDDALGCLLILGEPAAGKSATLYRLANDLLVRTRNEGVPFVPVVVSLSTWKGKEKTLHEWLVKTLSSAYVVKKQAFEYWIRQNELILLLDALDEISTVEARKSCVTAINKFSNDYSAQIVISSREHGYDDVREQLDLKAAIRLKSLDDDQIDEFLFRVGQEGAKLQELLTKVPKLKTPARVPFLLNIMVPSVHEIDRQIAAIQNQAELEALVLDAFVTHCFTTITLSKIGSRPSKCVTHLNFLANNMIYSRDTFFAPAMALLLEPYTGVIGWFLRSQTLAKALFQIASGFVFLGTGVMVGLVLIWSGVTLLALVAQKMPLTTLILLVLYGLCYLVLWKFVLPIILPLTNMHRRPTDKRLKAAYRRYRDASGYDELLFLRVILASVAATILAGIVLVPFGHLISYFASQFLGLREYSVSITLLEDFKPVPEFAIVWAICLFALSILLSLMTKAKQVLLTFLHVIDGSFPLNARKFLEDCVTLKFMYRATPFYAFIHSMLLEHFANLDPKRLNLEELDAEWERARRK